MIFLKGNLKMITITKIFKFEASHLLPIHQGKCKNLHGHSYKLEVTVGAKQLNEQDMVMDFGDLKEIVNKEIINKLDHQHLNQFYINPTAENMVIDFFNKINDGLFGFNFVFLDSIRLWETDTCFAEKRRIVKI